VIVLAVDLLGGAMFLFLGPRQAPSLAPQTTTHHLGTPGNLTPRARPAAARQATGARPTPDPNGIRMAVYLAYTRQRASHALQGSPVAHRPRT
jgi:hypothetical protein